MTLGLYLRQNFDAQFKSDKIIPIQVSNRVVVSVTRLGDLLDFGPLFKALGNN